MVDLFNTIKDVPEKASQRKRVDPDSLIIHDVNRTLRLSQGQKPRFDNDGLVLELMK